LRATLSVFTSISRRAKEGRVHWHWRHWPETTVGASFARDAPRGRRSISQAQNVLWRAPGGLDTAFAWNIPNN